MRWLIPVDKWAAVRNRRENDMKIQRRNLQEEAVFGRNTGGSFCKQFSHVWNNFTWDRNKTRKGGIFIWKEKGNGTDGYRRRQLHGGSDDPVCPAAPGAGSPQRGGRRRQADRMLERFMILRLVFDFQDTEFMDSPASASSWGDTRTSISWAERWRWST